MITLALCVSLFSGVVDTDAAMKKDIYKQIIAGYKVDKNDAWTIADAVVRNSKRYDVPIDVILSVIAAESAYNKHAVSPKGAVGLMQVMPATGEHIASKIKPGEYKLSDIRVNIRFGTWYLKSMYKRFGNYSLAVRAYNCGPTRVAKVLANQSQDYPDETNDYHDKVVAKAMTVQVAMQIDFNPFAVNYPNHKIIW